MVLDFAGEYLIQIRKLSSAAPYLLGLGGKIFKPSVLYFFGLSHVGEDVTLVPYDTALSARRMQVYGEYATHELSGAAQTANFRLPGNCCSRGDRCK